MYTTIYLCEDNLDSILTGVYDAWASRKGHSHVRLQMKQETTMELFCDYISVEADTQKAEKVSRSIKKRFPSRHGSSFFGQPCPLMKIRLMIYTDF